MMKKALTLLMAVIGLFAVPSCAGSSDYGSSNDSEIGNGTEYATYKEALAVEDFEAAHKILAQAEADEKAYLGEESFTKKYGFSTFELWRVKTEILKSELAFLVAQNNEEFDNRIIFLLNENKSDEYCNHVATLAAYQGNEKLVKKVALLFNDMSLFLNNKAVSDFCKDKDKDFYVEIQKKYNEKLLEKQKEDYDNLLTMRKDIAARPQLGIVKSDHYGDLDSEYDNYIWAVSRFNRQCINEIIKAIENSNTKHAQKILKLMKKNIKYEDLGDWCKVVEKEYDHSSVYEAFRVTEDDSDLKEARELLNNSR